MSDKASHIWITRTALGAAKSGKLWQAAGFKTSLIPLMQLRPVSKAPSRPLRGSSLIFTSINGVSAYAALGYDKEHHVITVGDATARAAKDCGFKNVISAGGASQDVTNLITQNLSKAVPIIHCAGEIVRGSITEDLQQAGYRARRDIYYETCEAELELPDMNVIDVIAFYSPLGARSFAKRYGHLDLKDVTALSLSTAVDVELEGLKFARRLVSPQPNETAMQGLLLGGAER